MLFISGKNISVTSNKPFPRLYKQRRANKGVGNSLPTAAAARATNGCRACKRAYCNSPRATRGSPNKVVPSERSPSRPKNGQSDAVADNGTIVCAYTTGFSSQRNNTSRSCTCTRRGKAISANSSASTSACRCAKRCTRKRSQRAINFFVNDIESVNQLHICGEACTPFTCENHCVCNKERERE